VVNAPQDKRLTGRIAPERIRAMTTPRSPAGTVERFKAIGDPTGVVSDAMDELGVAAGVVGAHVLRPTIPGATMVGPALTLRNVLQRADPLAGARNHVNRMAEFEAHNLASPGDVLVIQGVANISNMGGISAQTGKRQGEAGAVVMGGIRDIAHSRAVDYPLWASEITPVTGQMASGDGRDQRADPDRRGPGRAGRSRDRRRHRRLLRPARLYSRSTGACREEGEGRRRPLQGDRRRHSGPGHFARALWGEIIPMAKYVVAPAHEISPGGRKLVAVGGRKIVIFNLGGEFFAVSDRCPHQGGPLSQGVLTGFVSSREPGEYCYSRRGEVIRCPWHSWEYDIRTGKSWCDPRRIQVRHFEVGVEAGARLVEGPYVAETFPVSVEDEYVVVTL
jgi:nitrite reductase/ring-hydroxylating ferredoxin subunit/regulator of RNase E activity RraA